MDYERILKDLSEPIIVQLGEFYVKQNPSAISDWLGSRIDSPRHDEEQLTVRNLLQLFGHLGERGYTPFTDQAYTNVPLPIPDWEKLPHNWRFLADAALVCAAFPFPECDEDNRFVQSNLEQKTLVLLRSAAEEIKRIGWRDIKTWCSEYGVFEHVEAAMIFNLLGCLSAFDIPYS